MRKRRLFLAAGACVATLALAVGTAVADPDVGPPPYRPVEGSGAQTTQGVMNDLCNNIIVNGSGNPICASYDIDPQPSNITTRDPATTPGCTFSRPNSGGPGFDALIAHPTCLDFARVVTSTDSGTRPVGFAYIPLATDALTYAVRGDSTVPLDLDAATLKRIYQCDPALTFPSNPGGFKPLLGVFGAGNRTLFFSKLGITDSATYTTANPCVHDGFLANDGRVLTDPRQLITYSSAPYLAQINQVEPDIHGSAILGSINGISPEVLNVSSFIARTVYNVVRNTDADGTGAVHDLFIGPSSQVCSNVTAIERHGFTRVANCGDKTLRTTN